MMKQKCEKIYGLVSPCSVECNAIINNNNKCLLHWVVCFVWAWLESLVSEPVVWTGKSFVRCSVGAVAGNGVSSVKIICCWAHSARVQWNWGMASRGKVEMMQGIQYILDSRNRGYCWCWTTLWNWREMKNGQNERNAIKYTHIYSTYGAKDTKPNIYTVWHNDQNNRKAHRDAAPRFRLAFMSISVLLLPCLPYTLARYLLYGYTRDHMHTRVRIH